MRCYLATILILGSFCARGTVEAQIHVVATIPSLGALATEVGGEHVEVRSLAAPNQDPHFVDGRPSMALLLNRADLLIHVGLGRESGWLPPLLTNARNGRLQPGRSGNLDTSSICGALLGVRGRDRRFGDIHPAGNPHFLYDPRYGVRVAQAIADRLAAIDPAHARDYRAGYEGFARRMRARIAEWESLMAPFRGQAVVGYHESLVYLARWLGLRETGFIQPLPGIPPNPRHLARLILEMRSEGARVVLVEPWYEAETSRVVAERTGATVVRLPGDVGAPHVRSYPELIDRVVQSIHRALSGAGRR